MFTNNIFWFTADVIFAYLLIFNINRFQPQEMLIRAGAWTQGILGTWEPQIKLVTATAIHPVFNSGSLVKDQAIIFTADPFQFDENVGKVCVPQSIPQEFLPKSNVCLLSGWGRNLVQSM